MTERTKIHAYARRFARVLDHIDRNLDGPLPVEELSAVAHFSKFHFHRQFSNYIGIPIGRYIQLVRLRRASQRLVFNPDDRIIDIALDAGFDSPEAFSRAFKAAFDQTPSAFRRAPEWQAWSERYQFRNPTLERTEHMDVQIVDVEPQLVAVLEHTGSPALLPASVQTFIAWRRESGFSPVASSRTMGIAYSDPELTPPDEFRFDICGTVTAEVPENAYGVITKTIPGGRCALLRHIGSRDRIGVGVYSLYRTWLPASGEELRDFPVYFHYLNLDHETPEHEHATDIYLPLASRAGEV